MAGYNADTMSWQVPDTDTVYVDGLPQGISEKDVEEFFGSIGIIKTDKKTRGKKIWLYRDKATGALKGDGTVSYEDPFSAGSAVEWFNGKDWKGVFCWGGCCRGGGTWEPQLVTACVGGAHELLIGQVG